MIVSFHHRFLFVAIPKTATHAFRMALRPHLGPHDWEQCGLFERKTFPVAALADIGHGHLTCREIRPFLLPDTWQGLFRFCTVRNPYDRFVSYCCFMNRDTDRMRRDPLATMKQAMEHARRANRVLFRPQSEFVVDDDGRLLVDHVGKQETLQEHFDHVCGRLGLPRTPLPRVNASGSSVYRPCFDRELTEMVQDTYRADFELFSYPLERA